MANVVGLTVWVKLKHPPNTIVYGVVKDLVPNSHLTLQNVLFPRSNTKWEHWSVQATAIENLEVIDPSAIPAPQPLPSPTAATPAVGNNHTPTPPIPSTQQPPTISLQKPTIQDSFPASSNAASNGLPRAAAVPTPTELPAASTPQKPAFIDPAIISYGNASPKQTLSSSKTREAETPIKSMLARAAAANLPSPGSPFIADAGKANLTHKLATAAATRSATAQSPSRTSTVPHDTGPTPAAELPHSESAMAKKKIRRGQKSKKSTPPAPMEAADPPPIMNSEVSRNGNDMNGNVKRGKGWRNTPLLQPSSASPIDKSGKKSRRTQKEELDALGDTTDIADMGDFDFEGELKKFDKKQVFDEIRQGDTTADEDRLVSHNRAARPGTYGGKNLHPTESVLSPKLAPQYNSNELDNTSDADTELNLVMNGRSSSKHSVTRAAISKVKPSKQNSSQVEKPHPLTASISSDKTRNLSTNSLVTRSKAASLATSSPRHDHRPGSPHSAPGRPVEPHFAIFPRGIMCPTLLPRALDSLEAATVSTFGITHDAITENAARAIAEAALQLSGTHSELRRPSRQNTLRGSLTPGPTLGEPSAQEQSTIVILSGNHAIGARALAAARQLLGRNVKIIAAEGLYENAEVQDSHSKAQSAILRRMARGGANIKRGLWRRVSRHIKNLSGPPTVIIDALLAGATYDSLLSSNAAHSDAVQLETREMIDWANRSRAPVLSIGCPSGVSGTDGISTIVEGEPLAVRPDRILALAAPMQGLLKAMDNGEVYDHISVADIGINIALKSDEAVGFGQAWSVDVRYTEAAERRDGK